MRGYLSHRNSLKQMAQTKINMTAAFFRNIRGDYQISAQILIAYHFRKYLIKKKK
jgi:hypothetical protein